MSPRTAYLLLALALFAAGGVALAAGRSKPALPYHDPDRVPAYNPDAEWRKTPCRRCDGKGFLVDVRNDAKRNRTTCRLVPCPRCKGKGHVGMSRK